MKILAKAYPNPLYINHNNLKDVVLEARLVNDQVRFYETHPETTNKEICLSEKVVRSLFPLGKSKTDQPFLKHINKEFWAVLYRRRKRHNEQVTELKTNGVDFVRTKHKNQKPCVK